MPNRTASIKLNFNTMKLYSSTMPYYFYCEFFYCKLPENLIPLKFSISASLNDSKPKQKNNLGICSGKKKNKFGIQTCSKLIWWEI